VHLWDWVESTTDEQEWINIVFEDFPHNNSAHIAHKACETCVTYLSQSCGESSRREKMRRWLFDCTLGSLDQMRVELETRFGCEQFWVVSYDKVKIDCMFIPAANVLDEGEMPPTILFCNPNAGYYEYSYY
jgi:hypothetical protein